jgi:hypothetical protein
MNDLLLESPQSDAWMGIVTRLGGAEAITASARNHGAFQRSRCVKSAEDLLRLILAYGPGGRSLRVTAAEATARGSPMCPMWPCSTAFGAVPTG